MYLLPNETVKESVKVCDRIVRKSDEMYKREGKKC